MHPTIYHWSRCTFQQSGPGTLELPPWKSGPGGCGNMAHELGKYTEGPKRMWAERQPWPRGRSPPGARWCSLSCSRVFQVTYMISRKRSDFGASVKFSDQNASTVKDAYIECTAYPDKNFTLKQLERDVGMQAVPQIRDTSTQTRW